MASRGQGASRTPVALLSQRRAVSVTTSSMLKIAPALFTFLSLAAADDGAAVLGVAAGARNGVVAGTNLGEREKEAS